MRFVSLCAGQGADLLAVAEHHPRGRDLHGRLVELDPRNVAVARGRIEELGLEGWEVVEADAGRSDAYAGAVPADLVVACGIFGNITDADIEAHHRVPAVALRARQPTSCGPATRVSGCHREHRGVAATRPGSRATPWCSPTT